MHTLVQIVVKPEQQEDLKLIYKIGLQKAQLQSSDVSDWRIRKRSIDARKPQIKINLQLEFWTQDCLKTPPQNWTPSQVDTQKNSHYRRWTSWALCST